MSALQSPVPTPLGKCELRTAVAARGVQGDAQASPAVANRTASYRQPEPDGS